MGDSSGGSGRTRHARSGTGSGGLFRLIVSGLRRRAGTVEGAGGRDDDTACEGILPSLRPSSQTSGRVTNSRPPVRSLRARVGAAPRRTGSRPRAGPPPAPDRRARSRGGPRSRARDRLRARASCPRANRSKTRSRPAAGTPGSGVLDADRDVRPVTVDEHTRRSRRRGSRRSRPGWRRPARAGACRRRITTARCLRRHRGDRSTGAAVGGLADQVGDRSPARAGARRRRRRGRSPAGRRPAVGTGRARRSAGRAAPRRRRAGRTGGSGCSCTELSIVVIGVRELVADVAGEPGVGLHPSLAAPRRSG